MRRMSAGSGYQYLLRSVAAGDGQRAMSTPLTRYYSEVGTPPGRWLGSGVGAFGAGQIRPGMQVTEEQLALLVGMGRDPVTGEQLGRAYPSYKRLADRIEERVAALDPEMTQEDCAAETTRIEAEETAAGMRRAVAGFDLTFSVPKSVSVLWGVADAVTQERIVAAHHAAVADVIDLFEREVAATRAGISDRDGAVAQVDVAGVAAVAYDHFDSRAGDPQLHTHVVIANKVLTVMDGRWRSLDGRPVFASRTGLSAHYDALLADRLSRDLGIEWELRQRGPDRNARWEIAGVSDDLITEFSSRTREIELKKDELIAEYAARHGRTPSAKTIVELRAQATLATRPPKEVRSLADLTADWRQRAAERLGTEPSAWSRDVIGHGGNPLTADDVPLAAIEAISADVVAAVSVKRAVWTHWNLMAEASKQTMDLRFATTEDREAVVGLVVDAAQSRSVVLTPPELATQPGPVPEGGRHEPVPSAARREVLLDRGARCRGAPVGSCREGDRADGGRERCGASGRDWKGPVERATAPCGGEHLPARDARSTYSSGRPGQARPPRCERSEQRGPRSAGGGAWSVWRRPPLRPRRWPTTSASRARTRRSGSTSTTTAAPNSAVVSW